MLYSLRTADVTKYTGDKFALYNYVGALSPDSIPIIDSIADAATTVTEKYIGTPLGKRSIKLVISRGESEVNDSYFRTWFQGGAAFGGGINGYVNEWVQLPVPCIDSIQSVSLGTWQQTGQILLTEGQDFTVDYNTEQPRLMFSYNLMLQDYFYKYKNTIIEFTGGLYEVDGTIPSPVDAAIKYLTNNMFNQRGGEGGVYMDNGYKFLLANYKEPATAGGRM